MAHNVSGSPPSPSSSYSSQRETQNRPPHALYDSPIQVSSIHAAYPSRSTSNTVDRRSPTFPTRRSNDNSPHVPRSNSPVRDEFHRAPPLRATHSNTSSNASTVAGQSQGLGSPKTPGGSSIRSHDRDASASFVLAHAKSRDSMTTFVGSDSGAGASGSKREESEYESIEHELGGRTWLGGLIRPPVVRQFLHKDYLFKEEEERGMSHFELFADLVFVAIVQKLGKVAADDATIFNALKFILMFWPPWSIWADMRSYLNVSGTDDLIQRAYILITSFLLIGYTAQATGIEIGSYGKAASGGNASAAANTSHKIVHRMLSALIERAAEEGPKRKRPSHMLTGITNSGYAALHAATTFFLIAKSLRIILLLLYAWYLPRFRVAHLVQALFTLIPCLVFVSMYFVQKVVDGMVVFLIGVILEIVGKYMVGVVVHLASTRKTKNEYFIPALEIGHVIEKTTAFFVLVAGEILLSLTYVAKDIKQIGATGEFARSCLGITIAFLLCWLYFDSDSCKVFVHALRRHWFSSITWTQLHLPLCISVVIAASAIHSLIVEKELEQGIRWYFGLGMAGTLVCLSIMGFLHCSLDKPGSNLFPRWVRLCFRLVMAGFFCAFPFVENSKSSTLEMGFYCAGLGAVVLVETIGKIGAVGNIAPPLPAPGANGTGPESRDVGNYGTFSHGSQYEPSRPPSGRSVDTHHSGAHAEHASGVEYLYGTSKRYKRDDLTAYEKGEEDMGGDEHLGVMKAVHVRRGQRTGFAAF